MSENIEQVQENGVVVEGKNELLTVGEVQFSPQVDKLFGALAKFTQQVKQPEKNAFNPFTKSKYVNMDETIKSVNAGMKGTGLSYMQVTVAKDGLNGVQTIVTHESGQFAMFPVFGFKSNTVKPQEVGAFLTYARRYSLSGAFGLASDSDDDGNQANDIAKEETRQMENAPAPIDRTKILSDIPIIIDEIVELTGSDFDTVKQDILRRAGGRKQEFNEYQGEQLKTVHAIAKRVLEVVKQRPKQEASKARHEAEKEELVEKAKSQAKK